MVQLAVLRALEEANIETNDDLLFVGVVGEEGLGDLRGMKHIYRDPASAPDAWIEVDGGGLARLVVDGPGAPCATGSPSPAPAATRGAPSASPTPPTR